MENNSTHSLAETWQIIGRFRPNFSFVLSAVFAFDTHIDID